MKSKVQQILKLVLTNTVPLSNIREHTYVNFLGLYRVQVFNSGSNRFRRVDSGLNLGSDVDSVVDMDLDLDSDSDTVTDIDID